MHWASLTDGRHVLVSAQNTRMVKGKEYFVPGNYAVVLLEGSWQVVRKDKLKPVEYGSPFQSLR